MATFLSQLSALFGRLADFLVALFNGLLSGLGAMLVEMLTPPAWVVSLLSYAFASIACVVFVTTQAATMVSGVLSSVLTKTGTVHGGTFSPAFGAAATVLAGINTFFPLDEMCSFVTVYAAIYLTCAGIRSLKAWLPTLT